MQTFREHYNRRSSAILPTNSTLHVHTPEKNEFHSTWHNWDNEAKAQGKEPAGGTYLLLKKHDPWGKSDKPNYKILSGSGHPDNYPNVGEGFEAHHDQSGKRLGYHTVVAKTTHAEAHKLGEHVKSAKLYVYK